MIILKILIFVLASIIGLCFLVYAEPLVRTFGKAEWAERRFGTMGGSYLVWKLAGILIIVLGFLFLMGGLDWLIFPK
ncbi:MAG TPA: hypothetical protein VJJ80_00120 [Patescibacteria group bacterium]|nr:hypothetical protein [Patescibacteria group bacterium]